MTSRSGGDAIDSAPSAAAAVGEALGDALGSAAARAARHQRATPVTKPATQPKAQVRQPSLPLPPAQAHLGTRFGRQPPQISSATAHRAPALGDSRQAATSRAAARASPARSSVVKIDIPSLLDTGSSTSTSTSSFSQAPPAGANDVSGASSPFCAGTGVRRRASIQNSSPPSSLVQSSPRRSLAPSSPLANASDATKDAKPAPVLKNRYSSTLASAFLRHKQPFLSRELSSGSANSLASSTEAVAANVSAPRLFFQDDTVSECESQDASGGGDGDRRHASSDAPSRESSISSAAAAADSEQLWSPARKHSSDVPAAPSSPRRCDSAKRSPPADATASREPRERVGELSREEDEFDFAILLKPSKSEEPLDLPRAPNAVDGSLASQRELGGAAASVNHAHLRAAPTKHPRQLVLARIRHTGLHVKRLLSLDGKQTLLKVKAPQHVLEAGAERLKLRKPRKFDRIWMEFSRELRATFADFDEQLAGVRFIDSEKQSIVHALLTAATTDGGAGLNEFCPLKTKYVERMFPLHKQDLGALETRWVTYWRRPPPPLPPPPPSPSPSSDANQQPPHQPHHSRCRALATGVLAQPIDDVAQYFGEKVAFYFAWMEMYTRWLLVPSAVGLALFALQVSSRKIDHPLAPLYAVFMALWTSAFLIAWKRRASALAYRWGTLGYEEDTEVTRPEFYGDPAVSTPERKRYPAWRRYAKYAVTLPAVLASMALITVVAFAAFSTRDRLERASLETATRAKHVARDIAADLEHGFTLANLRELSKLGLDWRFWFYFLITPLLYGLLIPALDFVFTRWARAMTNWENHETESRHRSHLTLKVVAFRFVHVFASLYYYAFAGSRGDHLLRVAIQLASFMVAGQLWKNVVETLFPFVRRRWLARRKKRATDAQFSRSAVFNASAGSGTRRRRGDGDGGVGVSFAGGAILEMNSAVIHEQCVRLEQASDKAWEEAELQPYDTFEDYAEMLIQFGYVSFFSLAFPLAPLLALTNNVVELRTDAFKLCRTKQRPIARKASGIGIWFHVLQLMSVLAVLTNCLHVAFTTSLLERLVSPSAVAATPTAKVWLAFGVEHLLLALKVAMMLAIPPVPRDVQRRVRVEREQAQLESARAMAAKMLLLAPGAPAGDAPPKPSPALQQ